MREVGYLVLGSEAAVVWLSDNVGNDWVHIMHVMPNEVSSTAQVNSGMPVSADELCMMHKKAAEIQKLMQAGVLEVVDGKNS